MWNFVSSKLSHYSINFLNFLRHSHEYLMNGFQGHPVQGLVSNGRFLLQFYIDVFADLRNIFQRFLNRNFESFLGLDHMYFDLVRFRMPNYASMSNFWCHFLIDGLIINQIGLLLPVRGRAEFIKWLGLTAGDSFSPHPLPLLNHPLPTSPQFFAHPRRASLLARLLARLFDLSSWKRKGNGCYAG